MADLPEDANEDMEAYETELRASFGRKLRRREASKAYNDRNRESRNLKKRERMAALRASRANEPPQVAEDRRAAAREAARVYREDRSVSPIPISSSSSRAPSPVSGSASPPPYARQPMLPRPVYAVRVDREGEIYTNFRHAWARHRLLERQGETPVLVVATSVVHALDWIENAPLAAEREVIFREIIEEAIEVYRQDEPDNSLDNSRSGEEDPVPMVTMAELVAELDSREARAHWRRLS
ncbi:hypothetical protein B0H16DRAFT_1465656 [Mycena metata]|uniref:Uncharacterized protein n=1 Tax=Mycena metata TaxID=1033252 RepID=A0AAD7MZE8_9AGAR|nr:hypothetical protein B0H16DRAFT_1465656 [Mycena metata]